MEGAFGHYSRQTLGDQDSVQAQWEYSSSSAIELGLELPKLLYCTVPWPDMTTEETSLAVAGPPIKNPVLLETGDILFGRFFCWLSSQGS